MYERQIYHGSYSRKEAVTIAIVAFLIFVVLSAASSYAINRIATSVSVTNTPTEVRGE